MRYDEVLARVASASRTHSCAHRRTLSRRRFLQSAAGATVLGAATTKGIFGALPALAAPGLGQALPIPATLELLPGHEFHVQAPPFTGIDTDPGTVANFQGAAAIGAISGSCTRTDRKTGEVRTLPFLFNDMRFQKGVFRGRDGRARDCAFAFT